MLRRGWIVAVAALLLVGALGWYFGSPYYTLWQMKRALENEDADALAPYIDFPAVRDDLKDELTAQIGGQARRGTALDGFALAFGPAVIGTMVDTIVTPAGVRAMLANRPQDDGRAAAGFRGTELPERPEVTRRGMSEFVVTQRDGRGGGLIFTRHGLGWKLSGFDFPQPPGDS